jgi:hypothetical protein
VYRASRAGRPILAKGTWKDADTFVIEYDEGPSLASYPFRIRFHGGEVLFEVAGLGTYLANKE